VYLTIQEGKFHQVKKMFHAVGLEVIYLKRVSMGGLNLDESLKVGDFRPLTQEEIDYLKGVTND
jgi:16S rRNA pseudouridine516 synthase